MLSDDQKDALTRREIVMQTSRSSGKGGQHVNKTESRVELSLDVAASQVLDERQRRLILARPSMLTAGRYLRVQESGDRSQHANRGKALEKLFRLIDTALKPRKKRVATKPSRSSKEKKLKQKKRRSETKRLRGRVD